MHGDASWVGGSGIAAFIGFAAQVKPTLFDSAGASTLHTLSLGFNRGGATGTQGIGVCSAEVC